MVRVFLADDGLGGSDVLGRMLAEDGYAVEVCSSKETPTRIEEADFDVLVTNLITRTKGGALALARTARRKNAHVVVVFVTEHTELLGRQPPLPQPCAVITKPVPYTELVGVVEELLSASTATGPEAA